MILTNHGKHLTDAFVDLSVNISEIKVSTLCGTQVIVNQNLLKLFSPFLRGIFATIPQYLDSVLIMPDSSFFALSQINKIFSKGVSDDGIMSYKDISEIVETGKLFGLDLSNISYEQIKKKDTDFPRSTGVISKESDIGLEDIMSEDDTASDIGSLEETADINECVSDVQLNSNYQEIKKQGTKEMEPKVKKEKPDNLLSFCEGIKGLIGKSLGIESSKEEHIVPASENFQTIKIKKEISDDYLESPEVFDIDSDSDQDETPSVSYPSSVHIQANHSAHFQGPTHASQVQVSPAQAQDSPLHSSSHVQANPVNMMFHPMQQMPANLPMVSSMYTNSFTTETPPPDSFQGYHHQNVVQNFPQHPNPATMFMNQDEHQNKMMNVQKLRMDRQEEPPKKKLKQYFTCKFCKVYQTPHEEHFKRHLPACRRLNPKGMSLDCRICSFETKNPEKFHYHLREEHIAMISTCDHCVYTTFYESQMKKHISKWHPSFAPKPKYTVVSSLRDRPSRGDEGKTYSCRKCDYEGPHWKALQQHKTMKHGEKTPMEHGQMPNQTSLGRNSTWRKEMGWGPDDKFTCDFWNFVGKGHCKMENGHTDGKLKISRYHVCSLCFRNTGQNESHPATLCTMFPQPQKEKGKGSLQAGEKGPTMADMGMFRGSSRNSNEHTRTPSREKNCSPREEGEVEDD